MVGAAGYPVQILKSRGVSTSKATAKEAENGDPTDPLLGRVRMP